MHLSSNISLDSRAKFILGGALILAAVEYLNFSSTMANAEYFMTLDQLHARNTNLMGQNLPIYGAFVGSTMQFNPNPINLSFDSANVPGDNATLNVQGGLAKV